jgi:hypothetical protein
VHHDTTLLPVARLKPNPHFMKRVIEVHMLRISRFTNLMFSYLELNRTLLSISCSSKFAGVVG